MKLLFTIQACILQEFTVLFLIFGSICARRFDNEGYYPMGYYDGQQEQTRNNKINAALAILEQEHGPQYVNGWPDPSVKMGQVSGLALDNNGQLLVFHRASNVWDAATFSSRDVYLGIGEPPIKLPTILVFNETGELVDTWGQNLFYIPHGITTDRDGNVWLTDVAMHQVFKFAPEDRQHPALVLGEKFVPGNDDRHFCKPSAVAALPSGDFFVADGYCNHRILKYSAAGDIILQWGRTSGESPFTFNVPHALTLAEDRGLVCVADRERGRVACFRADSGAFAGSYSSWLLGGRLFSAAYAPAHGGRLYVVNGPDGAAPVRGYIIDFASGRLVGTFAPPQGLANPHDVVTSPDGSRTYVAELQPFTVHKFVDDALRNETAEVRNATAPAKPTATIEVSSSASAGGAWEWWSGAAGGAGGAAGAALVALAAVALLRARNRGKRASLPRRDEEPLYSGKRP